jgi:hypothetical protein
MLKPGVIVRMPNGDGVGTTWNRCGEGRCEATARAQAWPGESLRQMLATVRLDVEHRDVRGMDRRSPLPLHVDSLFCISIDPRQRTTFGRLGRAMVVMDAPPEPSQFYEK